MRWEVTSPPPLRFSPLLRPLLGSNSWRHQTIFWWQIHALAMVLPLLASFKNGLEKIQNES